MEIFWFMCLSLVGGLAAFIVFLYNLKKGQFDDVEDIKYQLFNEDDE